MQIPLLQSALNIPWFIRQYIQFSLQGLKSHHLPPSPINLYPCLLDNTSEHFFEPHYIYHLAWAARVLKRVKPKKHIDISSSLHFSTIISAFIPTEYYDLRPANILLSRLKTKKGNLLKLPFKDNSIESLSCMHTVEHIGLGRYGDDLDPSGDKKAMSELKRVLSPAGNLLFVTPVGKEIIRFNAHRIYDPSTIEKYFKPLRLREFTLIPDDAVNSGIVKNASFAQARKQRFGCGCFIFSKQ